MNRILMEDIVRHILSNLAIIPSSFVDPDKTKSLMSKDYLLPEKISFEAESEVIKNKVWGCQISVEQQELKFLLGDCTQEKNIPEYCLVVKLKDAPAYGMYLVYNDLVGGQVDSEPLIACTLNGKEWMECQTYLQATFLAGMEQVRDVGLGWSKCTDYKENYELLLSFIQFHNTVYEAKYEGQEV
jgi:hypothetical protein